MTHQVGGQRFSVQPGVVAAYTETFARLLDLVRITLLPGLPEEEITDPQERTFHIPDMNCKHCRATITALLESMQAPVAEIDLVTKRVVAGFRTVAARERAFDAIRDAGYTVVPPAMTGLPPRIHPLVRSFLADQAGPAGPARAVRARR